MRQTINCIIFDFGGVIGYPQDQRKVEEMKSLTKMGDEFDEAYFLHRHEYDEGLIDKYEYWNRITNGSVELTEDIIKKLVIADYGSWTMLNQDTLSYIKEVKEEVDLVVLLSNINFEAKDYVRDELGLFKLFDKTFCSCDLHLMKPDIRIYEHVLNELDVCASKCLFIDDSLANIEGAKSVGMNGIHFKSFNQLKMDQLQQFQLCKTNLKVR